MAKTCTFYYCIFAQIDFICSSDEIKEKFAQLESDYYKLLMSHVIDIKLDNISNASRNELILWNEEYINKMMEEYKIANHKNYYEASQEKFVLKNTNLNKSIEYNAIEHENDALKFLSGVGRTYIAYIYEQSYYLSEFKQYYNRFKNTVTISDRDPRLNSFFRPFYTLVDKIKEKNVYNLKTFYGVSV